MGMEVHTDFNFRFKQREQLEKFIELLIEENRGRSLIAAYLMNTAEPGQSLKNAYIEQMDDAEQFDGTFDWKKYDDWFDAEDITVDCDKMSGSVMCFNEWDPSNLFPELFKAIAEAFPSLSFEGELETVTDEGATKLKLSYMDSQLKLITGTADFDNDEDDADTVTYQFNETEIKIGVERKNTFVLPEGIQVVEEDMIPNRKELVSIIIPEGVEEIGWNAFAGCKKLASIELPDSLKEIGFYAFEGCKALKHVKLPVGITSIGEGAFAGCESLTEIIIPEGITELTATFTGCKGLISISLPNSLRYINDENSGKRSFFCAGDIFSGCKSLKSVKLPEEIEVIGREAFKDCISLTNIEVPKNLKLIMKDAFENCPNLEHIEGLSCNTNLPYGVFDDCPKVNYTIPSEEIKSLGWWNVPEDRNAENITIPNSIVEIGHYGFEGWTNLTSAIIPEGVSRICEGAFSDCRSLKNIVIPESVTRIDEYAFQNCNSLEQIILPKGLKKLKDYAFSGCNNLISVQISGNTRYNRNQAFYCCENLRIQELSEVSETQESSKFAFDTINSLEIEGSIFVLTGFDADEEKKIENIIQQGGGVVKSSTVLKTNYLVVQEDYDHQTKKYTRALELKAQGKPIAIISEKQFYSLASK